MNKVTFVLCFKRNTHISTVDSLTFFIDFSQPVMWRVVILECLCRLDVKKRHIELTASVPLLSVRGRYTADGRVLILPIKGDGDANVTLGKSFHQDSLQLMSLLLVLDFLDHLA